MHISPPDVPMKIYFPSGEIIEQVYFLESPAEGI